MVGLLDAQERTAAQVQTHSLWAAGRPPAATAEQRVVQAARYAVRNAREAGWRPALARWTYDESKLPAVYGGKDAVAAQFVCSCDCMSCVHGQHCGMCRADNQLHQGTCVASSGCGS